jgi:hypothetical protein
MAGLLRSIVVVALASLLQQALLSNPSSAANDELPSFCVSLRPQFGPLGYQKRDENLCEGLYNPSVGAAPVELLSFVAQSELPSAATPVEIGALSKAGTPLHLVGSSMVPTIYYRLDAMLSPDAPEIQYNPASVATRAGLDLSQVGFVARDPDNIKSIYLLHIGPVSAAKTERANLVIKLSALANSVAWKWDADCAPGTDDWQQLHGSIFPPGSAITIRGIDLPKTTCPIRLLVRSDGQAPRTAIWSVALGQR